MNMRLFSSPFFVMAALLTFATGCHRQPTPQPDTVAAVEPAVDTVVADVDTVAEPVAPQPEAQPAPVKPKAKKQQAKATGPSRQVYVTGYNSYGRLWGYVTLKGDQGTGVIHDAEENHYNIRCTRHGDELFAVDQNSRQYVLKYSEE